MFRRIDRSKLLLKLLSNTSNLLATKRGKIILWGIGFVIVGFGLQVINITLDNAIIELLAVITHNLGVLIALITFLLAAPMGK